MWKLKKLITALAIVFAVAQSSFVTAADGPQPPRLFLYPTLIERTTEVGPVIRYGFVGGLLAKKLIKGGLIIASSHHPYAIGAYTLGDMFLTGFVAPHVSSKALSIYAGYRGIADLRDIANQPGVQQLNVLTAGNTEFKNIVASSYEAHSMVFAQMDSTTAPPKDWIPVDRENTKVRLSLLVDGKETFLSKWDIPLGELFQGQKPPSDILAGWGHAVGTWKGTRSFWENLFGRGDREGLRVTASLVQSGATDIELGDLIVGTDVNKLLGLGIKNKAVFAAKYMIFPEPVTPGSKVKARGIPVVEGVNKSCIGRFKRLLGLQLQRAPE